MWKENCCFSWPALAFHTITVLSTLPLRRRSPFLFHLSAKTGPACPLMLIWQMPATHKSTGLQQQYALKGRTATPQSASTRSLPDAPQAH